MPSKENYLTHDKGEDRIPVCLEALGKVATTKNRELCKKSLMTVAYNWHNEGEKMLSIDSKVEDAKEMDCCKFLQIIPKSKHYISNRLTEKYSLAT